MKKKYYFKLECEGNQISGRARTIRGIKRIFNTTNATKCSVYKRWSASYLDTPFVVYLK